MKRILFFMLFVFAVNAISAQSFTGKNDQKLQAGFNFYGYGTGIKATYDYGVSDTFSVGGGAVFFNSGTYNSGFFFFGRGDYHFQDLIDLPDELDAYIGAELGLVGNANFGLGGHLGGRYSFSNNLYAFLEIGNNAAVGVGFSL